MPMHALMNAPTPALTPEPTDAPAPAFPASFGASFSASPFQVIWRLLAVVGMIAVTAGCELGPTEAQVEPLETSDYALLLFGEAGAALEQTLGMQAALPFDGRSEGLSRLPAALALTPEQRAAIQGMRQAFQAEHQLRLAQLRSALERARASRLAGDPREEIRILLGEARSIAQSLQPAVMALHASIQGVLTPEQRAWLDANRPRRMPPGRSA